MKRSGDLSRVLANLSHGGHAVEDRLLDAAAEHDQGVGAPLVAQSSVVQQAPEQAAEVGSTPFNYLFPDLMDVPEAHLPADLPVTARVKALNDLGTAMIEQDAEVADLSKNSPIPPIYTYWGQFVDHDLTANTDRDVVLHIDQPEDLEPVAPAQVLAVLHNLRNPALNLDSVYGDGPFEPVQDEEFVPYDGIKLRLGELSVSPVGGALIPPIEDRHRDLPRRGPASDPPGARSKALIGDGRNDENLVIAQLHVAFLRFHNAAVDWVRANEPERVGEGQIFLRARDLTRWAYQWLTIHDYLRTVTAAGTVDRVLVDEHDLLELDKRGVYMPLEFSVAAFRFGHSMIRGAYDWNRNFGRPGNSGPSNASFNLLFTFTGKAPNPFFGTPTLPDNWPVEWDRMTDKNSLFADRFARRIDTHFAPPLATLANEGNQPPDLDARIKALLKHLARRNLLRGWLLSLPTGQAVADELGLPKLTPEELLDSSDQVKTALTDGGFIDQTPLWFYVLKEAEIKADGASLGPVGSQIVAATIIGQIRHDRTSYLSQSSWSPSDGVRLPDGAPIQTISDFLRFAGVL